MALLTIGRYRIITGDTTSASAVIEDAIEDATALLEEDLGGRKLESAERTERLKIYYSTVFAGGRVYPTHTPVTAVTDDDYEIVTPSTLAGVSPDTTDNPFFGAVEPHASVTYTGGFVERTANVGDSNVLPAYVEYDLAWAAHSILRPSELTAVPAGATSIRVGDLSVGYANPTSSRTKSSARWSDHTLKLRRRTV